LQLVSTASDKCCGEKAWVQGKQSKIHGIPTQLCSTVGIVTATFQMSAELYSRSLSPTYISTAVQQKLEWPGTAALDSEI